MTCFDVLVEITFLSESGVAALSFDIWANIGLFTCVGSQVVQEIMNFAEYTTASLHVTLEYLLVATSVWIPVLVNTEFLG